MRSLDSLKVLPGFDNYPRSTIYFTLGKLRELCYCFLLFIFGFPRGLSWTLGQSSGDCHCWSLPQSPLCVSLLYSGTLYHAFSLTGLRGVCEGVLALWYVNSVIFGPRMEMVNMEIFLKVESVPSYFEKTHIKIYIFNQSIGKPFTTRVQKSVLLFIVLYLVIDPHFTVKCSEKRKPSTIATPMKGGICCFSDSQYVFLMLWLLINMFIVGAVWGRGCFPMESLSWT